MSLAHSGFRTPVCSTMSRQSEEWLRKWRERRQRLREELSRKSSSDNKSSTSKDKSSEPDILWELTADQRQLIYEQEKRRIKQSSPVLSKTALIIIGIYSLGCLLLYFGIPWAFVEFCQTRRWVNQPEPDIFLSLFEAAIQLTRPAFAVLVTCWAVFIPVGLIWGAWSWGADFVRFIRRLLNRDYH